MMQDN